MSQEWDKARCAIALQQYRGYPLVVANRYFKLTDDGYVCICRIDNVIETYELEETLPDRVAEEIHILSNQCCYLATKDIFRRGDTNILLHDVGSPYEANLVALHFDVRVYSIVDTRLNKPVAWISFSNKLGKIAYMSYESEVITDFYKYVLKIDTNITYCDDRSYLVNILKSATASDIYDAIVKCSDEKTALLISAYLLC